MRSGVRINNAGTSSKSVLKDTSNHPPLVYLLVLDLPTCDCVCTCVYVHVLLTGCWGVGCLWSKEGHGHLRCLPWWRRISTQTVWLLKTETSPWAANKAMGQHSPYTVCVSASPQHMHPWKWSRSTAEFIYLSRIYLLPATTLLPNPLLSCLLS